MQNVSISIQISQLFLSVIRWQVSPCTWWALGFLCSGALSFKDRVANPFVKRHQRSSGFESSIYMSAQSFTACTLKSFILHRKNIEMEILGFMKLLEVICWGRASSSYCETTSVLGARWTLFIEQVKFLRWVTPSLQCGKQCPNNSFWFLSDSQSLSLYASSCIQIWNLEGGQLLWPLSAPLPPSGTSITFCRKPIASKYNWAQIQNTPNTK